MKRTKKQILLTVLTASLIGGIALTTQATEPGLQTLSGVPGNLYRDGSAVNAWFATPMGLDVKDGMVYIADTENNLIRTYYEGMLQTRTDTLAGNRSKTDEYGFGLGGHDVGELHEAMFNSPVDCLNLSDRKTLVLDRDNHMIRTVGPNYVTDRCGVGCEGYKEGESYEAMFSSPSGFALGKGGTIYVADTGNHVIRAVSRDGVTSLIAGVPKQGGLKDGAAREARFMDPTAVAVGEDGSLYVTDSGNQRIRRIKDGVVTTIAGSSNTMYLDSEYLTPGLADGQPNEALFAFPEGICMAGEVLLVADTGNHVIRAIAPSGETRTIAGTGEAGYLDGEPLKAELYRPSDLDWENGTLYIMDSGNSALRSMPFDPRAWLDSLK